MPNFKILGRLEVPFSFIPLRVPEKKGLDRRTDGRTDGQQSDPIRVPFFPFETNICPRLRSNQRNSGIGIENWMEIRIENRTRIRIESGTGTEIENEIGVEKNAETRLDPEVRPKLERKRDCYYD
ncbi:hypothetical protein EVAR_86745_1 [Eumeta japonica]|uniref:Uncharacterized protein n=1 Tax=Eumeta variegata TaxID=151549 RepID=A0A4C1W0D4_EUMVA|nr:hypothetical protein EVAR_86745_1 [Eumeta japonica]